MRIQTSGGLRPEIRLRYLAQVLEYEVEFSDFPKVFIWCFSFFSITPSKYIIIKGEERRFCQSCDTKYDPTPSLPRAWGHFRRSPR